MCILTFGGICPGFPIFNAMDVNFENNAKMRIMIEFGK